MREVFATAARWLDEDRTFALATLVALQAAATAPIGTTIAVDDRGEIVGNIGAGCYENEIVDAAQRTAADGRARGLAINLETEDELFGAPGCGAMMRVVAWRPDPSFAHDARAIGVGTQSVRVSITYRGADDSPVTFSHIFPAKERLIVVGATSLANELAAIAQRLDFEVVIVDPRPAFATTQRLSHADDIVRKWPDEHLPATLGAGTPIVILSHDPKFDLPALRCALRSPAPYIGLLGSRRSQAARLASLRADGFDEAALARIHGPAGLDIGGTTTAETAVSILAEIVANRYARDGAPLRSTNIAIHDRSEDACAKT